MSTAPRRVQRSHVGVAALAAICQPFAPRLGRSRSTRRPRLPDIRERDRRAERRALLVVDREKQQRRVVQHHGSGVRVPSVQERVDAG